MHEAPGGNGVRTPSPPGFDDDGGENAGYARGGGGGPGRMDPLHGSLFSHGSAGPGSDEGPARNVGVG